MNQEPYQNSPAWWEDPPNNFGLSPNSEDCGQKLSETPESALPKVTVMLAGGKSLTPIELEPGKIVTVTLNKEGHLNISTTLAQIHTYTIQDSSEPEKKKSGSPKENSTPSPSSNTDTVPWESMGLGMFLRKIQELGK